MEKVFVYGSLKEGYWNHERILKGLKYKKAMAPGINLYRGSSFPFAKRGPGTAIGELYEVDQETLNRLDRLEGHPNYYRREKTRIFADCENLDAWIYLYDNADKYELIESGEWK